MVVRRMEDLPVDGRRVFLRLDLNVPLDPDGNITDDTRIQAALPTLSFLVEREARLIVASHLGRPEGGRDLALSLEPVGARIAHLLDTEVILSEDSIGDGPRKMAFALREGQILMLENLRFYQGEVENDDAFAKQLASLADIYVNDAFAALHRAHASISGVPKYLKSRGLGLLADRELSALRRLLHKPERPYVAIVGGTSVRDKVDLLMSFAGHVDTLCLGGAMALTFLAAQGHRVGASRVELESIPLAEKVLRKAAASEVELLLPEDHVVVEQVAEDAPFHVAANGEMAPDRIAVDIGPRTTELFSTRLERAATVFWSGPLGVFEVPPFNHGTEMIGKAVARGNAFSVVGGGHSVAAIRRGGLLPFISHVSTGSGASLAYLEGRTLPGIAALEED